MTPTFETPASILSQELLDESFACAFEKGWWEDCLADGVEPGTPGSDARNPAFLLDPDKVWDRVPEKIALIHSELSEALEDYRVGKMVTVCRADGKPEGFPSELADVVIRVYDLLGAMGYSIGDGAGGARAPGRMLKTVPAQIAGLHLIASDAMIEWRGSPHAVCQFALEELVNLTLAIQYIANQLGIDLVAEIKMKQSHNRLRSHRHGGKVC